MNIEVKKTVKEDAIILSEIQKAAFVPLYERYHDKGNPCLRGVEDILKRLDSENFRYFTIFADGAIVGGILYKCKGSGPFFEELKKGEYYLQRVYINPAFQGKKIAQTAIKLAEAQLVDATFYSVDFPEDLTKNRMCYEATGFRDTGKRLEAEPGLVLACYEKFV